MKLATDNRRVQKLLKRFSWSPVIGQGHSKTKCTVAVEAYISTVWHRGSLV